MEIKFKRESLQLWIEYFSFKAFSFSPREGFGVQHMCEMIQAPRQTTPPAH